MRINSLWYRDNAQKWEVSEMDFFDLTLLVGGSGVGKTQILKAILSLKNIANGNALNSVEWNISFDSLGKTYRWEGKFEVKFVNNFNWQSYKNKSFKPKIEEEKIYLEENLLAQKKNDILIFEDKEMPKLRPTESIISIFREEEAILPAFEGLKKISFRDHTVKDVNKYYHVTDYKSFFSEYNTLEEIRNSDLDTILKLSCLYQNEPTVFNKIVESYKDVFPQVEKIRIEPTLDSPEINTSGGNPPIVIQFKEKGVNRWIPQSQLSSGMFRTFLHISEMFLLSDGTVVLIDEFENSLGVNCIDVLTEDLLFENNRLQFIATSHHPYIINKIPYEYWKIVTRKGGVIKTHNAQEFDLGASSHERFMNLINLPQYKSGIESLA